MCLCSEQWNSENESNAPNHKKLESFNAVSETHPNTKKNTKEIRLEAKENSQGKQLRCLNAYVSWKHFWRPAITRKEGQKQRLVFSQTTDNKIRMYWCMYFPHHIGMRSWIVNFVWFWFLFFLLLEFLGSRPFERNVANTNVTAQTMRYGSEICRFEISLNVNSFRESETLQNATFHYWMTVLDII